MKYTLQHGVARKTNTLRSKLTNLSVTSMFALTTLSGMTPLFLYGTANAAGNVNYTNAPFTSSELTNWTPDRTAPSGGYSSQNSLYGRDNVLQVGVDNAKASTLGTWYQTEGLQRQIPASDTVKADLYVDGAWLTNHVRAGLWGVAKDATNAVSAYPILEFTANNGGFTGWRAFDGVNGGWTNLSNVAYHSNSWNTVEISLNPITHQFNLFVNGSLATSNAGDVSTSLGAVILNDYNYATSNQADDYTVDWSNFAYGAYLPTTPITTTVSGNTSGGENHAGWMFNRDTTTGTPYAFTTDTHSTGAGSLYVPPIGTNPSNKFVAEDFAQLPVSDLNSISYDYRIGGNGTTVSAHQFYLNVYANIDNSTNFYDCRFDYVPTAGSTTAFSTAQFTATDVPAHVQQRGTRTTCPTTLAGMPAGSYVRMFSLSVGDTSASDAGLAGYLDNVVVNRISGVNAFDFEAPLPLPVPTVTSPADGATINKADAVLNWGEVKNPNNSSAVTYQYQSSFSPVTNGPANALSSVIFNTSTGTTSQIDARGSADATYYWQVRACDSLNPTNCSDWSGPWKVTIDSVAPAAPTNLTWKNSAGVTVSNNGYTNSTSGTASWQAVNDASHYVYKYWNDIPGNPYKAGSEYTTTTSATSLPGAFNQGEGVHHFCVAAVDAAGNTSACSATFTVTFDRTAPVVSIVAPSGGATVHGTVTISGTVTDTNPDHYYLVAKDSTGKVVAGPGVVYAANVTDWKWDTTKVTDDTYTIDLEARDKAGNKGVNSTKTISVTVDNTAPVISDATNFVVSMGTGDKVTLKPTVDDPNVTYSWLPSDSKLLNNPKDTLDGSSLDIGPAPKGSYTVELKVTDQAGNKATKTYSVTVTPGNSNSTGSNKSSGGSSTTFSTPRALFATPAAAGSVLGANTTSAQGSSTAATQETTTPPAPAGQVLGAHTTDQTATTPVKNDTAKLATATGSNSGKLLGISWQWFAALVLLLGIGWWILGATRNPNSKH